MLHSIILYALGLLTPVSAFVLSKIFAFSKRPVNLINGMVFPSPDDPGWVQEGFGTWILGPVRVESVDNRLTVDYVKVYVSDRVIKKYQIAIRTAHMRYMLESPDIKNPKLFDKDKTYLDDYSNPPAPSMGAKSLIRPISPISSYCIKQPSQADQAYLAMTDSEAYKRLLSLR